MGYEVAMKAAGAEVHEYEQFGDYQGAWWAKVTYEGNIFWVHGSYGSCSGCDAFQSEFDYTDETCDEHRYTDKQPDCLDCTNAKAAYDHKLAEFGRGYLTGNEWTQEEVEASITRDIDEGYDYGEYRKQLEFVKTHAIS
jgi:hypothetical protein